MHAEGWRRIDGMCKSGEDVVIILVGKEKRGSGIGGAVCCDGAVPKVCTSKMYLLAHQQGEVWARWADGRRHFGGEDTRREGCGKVPRRYRGG
jgi:hypothetical protein